MQEVELHRGVDFLLAGFDPSARNWAIQRVLSKRFDLLNDVAEYLASCIGARRVHGICALRASGITIGTLVAARLASPLFWFVDASDKSLFPRYNDISGMRLAVIDSHIISGGNMMRHTSILNRLDAIVDSAWVILDCNRFKRLEFRDKDCQKRIEANVARSYSTWRLSDLQPLMEHSAHEDDRLRALVASLEEKGESFWRSPSAR